eukprot:m.19976 g.19976  ORF g.19976 m.19976 type:complete len:63 (-) comp8103_c1_seq1:2425-2613(-)
MIYESLPFKIAVCDTVELYNDAGHHCSFNSQFDCTTKQLTTFLQCHTINLGIQTRNDHDMLH